MSNPTQPLNPMTTDRIHGEPLELRSNILATPSEARMIRWSGAGSTERPQLERWEDEGGALWDAAARQAPHQP